VPCVRSSTPSSVGHGGFLLPLRLGAQRFPPTAVVRAGGATGEARFRACVVLAHDQGRCHAWSAALDGGKASFAPSPSRLSIRAMDTAAITDRRARSWPLFVGRGVAASPRVIIAARAALHS